MNGTIFGGEGGGGGGDEPKMCVFSFFTTFAQNIPLWKHFSEILSQTTYVSI